MEPTPLLLEKMKAVHQHNMKNELDRRAATIRQSNWNNTTDVELVMRNDYQVVLPLIKEAKETELVPRFSLKKKSNPLFAKFPPNKEFKFSLDLIKLAISYGMILQIQYRGETGKSEDTFVQGHQRTCYMMCLGKSARGKILLRGYHLRGWSVSHEGNIQKEWRMFRADRILSMSFTGSFFRLPPAGYNMNDKGMRGGIILAADFDNIRKNQKSLVADQTIQNRKEVIMDDKEKVSVVQIDKTDTILNLEEPFANPNIEEKDKDIVRLTFLKSLASNRYICVLGALGQKNKVVKLTERGKYFGTFKVIKAMMGTHLGKSSVQNIGGSSEYELHVFIKKLN